MRPQPRTEACRKRSEEKIVIKMEREIPDVFNIFALGKQIGRVRGREREKAENIFLKYSFILF